MREPLATRGHVRRQSLRNQTAGRVLGPVYDCIRRAARGVADRAGRLIDDLGDSRNEVRHRGAGPASGGSAAASPNGTAGVNAAGLIAPTGAATRLRMTWSGLCG